MKRKERDYKNVSKRKTKYDEMICRLSITVGCKNSKRYAEHEVFMLPIRSILRTIIAHEKKTIYNKH